MQDMITDWNLHDSLFLFKVLQAEATLFLVGHVSKLVTCIYFFLRNCAELDAIHYFEVHTDDWFSLRVHLIFIFVKLAIASGATPPRLVAASLLTIGEEEADDFDEQDDQEKQYWPWNKD